MATITETAKGFCSFLVQNKYAVYVLVICMLSYLINQLNVFCLIATNNSMAQEIRYGERECQVKNETWVNITIGGAEGNGTAAAYCKANTQLCPEDEKNATSCYWRYLGRGIQYQLLAGPLYIVIFAISGVPMGLVAELQNINRKVFLSVCVILWSVMCALGGFATQYWHLAITRLLLGVFSAACVPFCASLIASYFTEAKRGAALGFYNWGIYVGYSITFLLIIAERNIGWRAVYFIAGIPGIAVGIVLLLTVRDPGPGHAKEKDEHGTVGESQGFIADKNKETLTSTASPAAKLWEAVRQFCKPALLLLCLGGAIRNGAGIVWAYNLRNFFDEYNPGTRVEAWMSWIPLVFGSLGAFGGGFISDRLSANRGPRGRLIVLIGCLLLSAPFQVGTLYAPMPWAFICHMPAYLIGEMWIGVCAAVVIELVPAHLTTSAVAVYFFIIQIIGGNMNLFVTPIRQSLDLRTALLITFPGLYVIGALIFIVTFFVLRQPSQSYELPGITIKEMKTPE